MATILDHDDLIMIIICAWWGSVAMEREIVKLPVQMS